MIDIAEKGDACFFVVLVKTGARHDRIVGEHDQSLLIEVTAPPVEGKANKAVVKLVARGLHVAPTSVAIVSGERSKHKRISVVGVSRTEVDRILSAFTQP